MIPVAWSDVRGWYYPPAAHAPAREPLLFLGPVGTEDLCARHSLAQLASALADQGHAVLRMDLPGTGDSLGDLLLPHRLDTWLDATRTALQQLRDWSGATTVGLLGLRLGALVALAACSDPASGSVGNLILLAPVFQGKQYLRELRTLAAPGDKLVVDGIEWGSGLQDALRGLNAAALPAPPVKRVLLAPGQGGKALQTWVDTCEGAELPLTTVPYGDLAAHIGETLHSQTPTDLWRAIPVWLAADNGTPALAPSRPLTGATLLGDGFREQGVRVESQVPLAAVWSEPADGLAPQAPVVILCNTGRNPHTSWARSWVHMARTLAAQGMGCIRFDVAGIGDSPPLPTPPDEVLYSDTSLPQVSHVLDWLEQHHGRQHPVVLAGLCTGGYLAFHAACADPRVTQLLLLNVQKFIWVPGSSLETTVRQSTKSVQAYRRLAFEPRTWVRLFKGEIDLTTIGRKFAGLGWQRVQRWTSALRPQPAPAAPPVEQAGPAPVALRTDSSIREGFAQLSRRGTSVTVLYCEEDGGRDEFARYYGASARGFLRLPHTRLTILTNADHMLTSEANQQAVLDEVLRLCGRL